MSQATEPPPTFLSRQWKPYPSYKRSGVEWLGEIPGHWDVARLKFVAEINSEVLPESTDPNYEIQYVDIGNVSNQGEIEFQPLLFSNAPSRARRRVIPGDVIISTVRTYLQAIAYFKSPESNTIVSTGFAVLRPRPEVDSRFLYYTISSKIFISHVMANSVGVSYPAINPTSLADLYTWIPRIEEQKQIARFLDRETTRIDTLITKKHQLIALLQKKRDAIIHQAVTRGLDPSIPLKDSGIPWIGKIPEHWKVNQLRRYVNNIEQGWSPIAEDRQALEGEWGVIKLSAVSKGEFYPQEHKALSESTKPDYRFEIKTGDLLISRSNTPLLVGDSCYVENTPPHLMLCDLVYRLSINENQLNKRFCNYFFLSRLGRFQIESDARGSSQSMVKISQHHIKSWILIFPQSLQEQDKIVIKLDQKLNHLKKIQKKLLGQLEYLDKYRQALITAAVTGKIDVREIVES